MVCNTPKGDRYYIPIYTYIPKDKTITIAQAYAYDSTGGYTDVKDKIFIADRKFHDNYFIPLYTTDSALLGKTIQIVLDAK